MAENKLNVRLQQKYAAYDVWQASSLILKKGELAICEIPSGDNTGLTPPAIGIKVGDGSKTFAELKWIQSTAGDVYAWAKAETKPTYRANEIAGLADFISGEIQDTNTTYTFTQNENVLTIKKAEKGGEYTDYATFDMSALATRVTNLETKVGTETVAKQIDDKITALNLATTYETIANVTAAKNELTTAIGTAKGEANTYTDTEVKKVTDSIGTVAEGKTVVQMISDAQTAATYDDTDIKKRVTNVETDVTTLKANAETEGSVDYKIAQAVAAIMENPDETMNSINELVTWVNNHAESALELSNKVTANEGNISTLQGLVGDTAVATQITNAITAALKVEGKDKYALATELTAAIARIATMEGKVATWDAAEQNAKTYTDNQIKALNDGTIADMQGSITELNNKKHEHANKTVLDGITAEKVTQWDAAQANVIESVSVGGVTATVANKTATIATIPTSALVDGTDVLILDCGGAE